MQVICPSCQYSHSVPVSPAIVGWNEIADFLRVSRSTAFRYYRAWNMPVERTLSGGHKVRTTATLIDAWLMTIINAQRAVEADIKGKPKDEDGSQEEH